MSSKYIRQETIGNPVKLALITYCIYVLLVWNKAVLYFIHFVFSAAFSSLVNLMINLPDCLVTRFTQLRESLRWRKSALVCEGIIEKDFSLHFESHQSYSMSFISLLYCCSLKMQILVAVMLQNK